MNLSVDISLYPLKDEYIPAIDEFIKQVESNSKVKVIRNTLSTQLFGDYDEIMDLLKIEFKNSYEKYGQSIFVTKFLMGDLSNGI